MKTIVWICISLGAALLTGGCDRSSALSHDDEASPHTIVYLRSLCKGPSVRIAQDVIVRGVVTANDIYGEFYKTLIIQDESGAIEIAADHPALSDDYPLYSEVVVHCNGLYLAEYGGKVQLGAKPDSEYGAGRIPQTELGRYIRKTADNMPLEAIAMTFGQVAIRHVGMYVRFDGVYFTQQGTWCDMDENDRPQTTDREIADAAGERFIVRTLSTCIYAKEKLPSGEGSLYGIIDYFNGKYSLRIIRWKVFFANSEAFPTAYPSGGECSAPTPMR